MKEFLDKLTVNEWVKVSGSLTDQTSLQAAAGNYSRSNSSALIAASGNSSDPINKRNLVLLGLIKRHYCSRRNLEMK